MGCCGGGGKMPPKSPAKLPKCADGRRPWATPDAQQLARQTGFDLCTRQGQGSGARGLITKGDVARWTS